MKHKKKKPDSAIRCPNCGSTMVLRSADGIYRENPDHTMLYVCKHYPECDTYVRTYPGTGVPMGMPANRELRALRIEAHKYFDQLYLSGIMSKKEAYLWLADLLQVPLSQAHISFLGEYYCRKVMQESQKVLETASPHRKEAETSTREGAAVS